MAIEVLKGIMIPFFGTSLGAACVFFMRKPMGQLIEKALTGFGAGVMMAASIWSLLLPAIQQSAIMGRLSFIPAAAGFWMGILFLRVLRLWISRMHRCGGTLTEKESCTRKTAMLALAVVLHNIPEGMAVGVIFAGWLSENTQIAIAEAMILSIGIAVQNLPEGAIISMPLRAEGMPRPKAFAYGLLSGIVEPAGAILTILAAEMIIPALPYFLSFAAGAMIHVAVEELIPDLSSGEHFEWGIAFFEMGFTLMMILDVALG